MANLNVGLKQGIGSNMIGSNMIGSNMIGSNMIGSNMRIRQKSKHGKPCKKESE